MYKYIYISSICIDTDIHTYYMGRCFEAPTAGKGSPARQIETIRDHEKRSGACWPVWGLQFGFRAQRDAQAPLAHWQHWKFSCPF